MSTTILKKEIDHFAKDSAHWWDEDGPFAILHRLNPVRMRYIRDRIEARFGGKTAGRPPLEGLKILDVGCGGGLVCEALARLGADVTGLDADGNAIATAKDHAELSGLKIDYREGSVESFLQSSSRRKPGSRKSRQVDPGFRRDDGGVVSKFDVITALEIVEHVADLDMFVQSCTTLCKPGGLLIFSTLNRTPKSWLLGIVAAENILRWVPRGTHDWKKFIRPSEMARILRDGGATPKDITGLYFNILSGDFELSDKDIDVNYLITAEKES